MKSRYILFAILAFIITLAISGCNKFESSDYSAERCKFDYTDPYCYIKAAINTNNISICEMKGKCLAALAIVNSDDSYCDIKIDENLFHTDYQKYLDLFKEKNECYTLFGSDKSILCDKVYSHSSYSQYKDCYEKKNLSVSYSDLLCGNFIEDNYKPWCYYDWALSSKKVEICEKIKQDDLKEQCKFEVSLLQGDEDNCNKLNDKEPSLTNSFRGRCFSKFGILKDDSTLCELSSGDTKLLCFALVNNDVELCSKYYAPKICYFELASKNSDESICLKIEDTSNDVYSRDSCIEGVAIKKNDESLCLKANSAIRRATCIEEIALNKNDFELCKKIKLEEWRSTSEIPPNTPKPEVCKARVLSSLAEKENDVKYCNMNDKGYESYTWPRCFMPVLESKRDISVCESLEFEQDRVSCIEQISIMKNENYCKYIDEPFKTSCNDQYNGYIKEKEFFDGLK